MKLYRKFRIAADGKPIVGTLFGMLGVRPAYPAYPKRRFDVPAILGSDVVRPGGGGLSVSTDPAGIRIQAADLFLFEIDGAGLRPGLTNVPAGDPHRLIEPAYDMTLDEFQDLLAQTRDSWIRV